jgi:lactoylglutathione lyase
LKHHEPAEQSDSIIHVHLNYAIVFVSDMARSVRFYRDIIGIPVKFESPVWTEFVTGGATLALHLGELSAQQIEPGESTSAGRCRPGFSVRDLNEFHDFMIENNVECVQQPKNVFGTAIAQYLDPDRLVLSVSEGADNN